MTDIAPITLNFSSSIMAGGVAPSSMKMYERDFKAYLEFAGSPTLAIQSSTLARWRASLASDTSYSPNTINRMLSSVKTLMASAEEQGYVERGTAQAFKQVAGVKNVALKHRVKQHARVRIEPRDMRRLCSAPDISTLRGLRDKAFLFTWASSGMRVSELCSLAIAQIEPREQGYQLSIMGKNDAEPRYAPLSIEAHHYIQAWLEERCESSPFIFTSFAGRGDRLTGNPLTEVSAWRLIRDYAKKAGLNGVKPHDGRRFVGTQLAKTNLRTAQKALGHKRISTTADNYVLDDLEVGVTEGLF